jgi:ribose/xylose/arabinose/galactoside ABC-type transport system permease subunit
MRFATDTGGTFTDLVIEREGQLHLFKSPTVPSNPVDGVLGAFSVAAEAFGMVRSELLGRGTQFIHGTTHAINAIVTGRVARTALLVSDGHPEILLLRAVREDEAAARASGVNAWLQKLVAFTVSAFVAGLGGVLYGHFLGTIAVSMFWLDMTFLTLAMLVVGGLRSLTGAVVGTLFVVALRESIQLFERGLSFGDTLLRAPEGTREIVLAIVLLAVLIFRPQGLVGEREAGERK